MSILKTFSFILFLLMFENIDAQAQFSYKHSDGTVISCNNPPQSTQEIEEGSAIFLSQEYADIKSPYLCQYMTISAKDSPKNPKQVTVQKILIADIDFNDFSLAGNALYLSSSKPTFEVYTNENGVKTKVSPTDDELKFLGTIGVNIENSAQIEAFMSELIQSLPADKQATVKKRLDSELARLERIKNPIAVAEKNQKPSDDLIREKGSSIVFNGRTYYKYDNKFYDASFQEFCVYFGGNYKIGDTVPYKEQSQAVSKNGQALAYLDMSEAFFDSKKSNKYLKKSNGVIYRLDKQIATYKDASHVASAWYIRDIVVLVDYFGL